MQLILKKDVENLGFTDDVVTVKNGYGRNYLIPQGYAVMATPSALKQHNEVLKQRAYKEQKLVDEAKALKSKIEALELKVVSKVGEKDKLFGSVTNANIAELLEKEGIELDKKFILVAGGSVKRTGDYTAAVRLHREVSAELNFSVLPEN